MAAQSRATLKNYFLGTPTFSVPTEAQYANLIDSFLNITDDDATSGYALWRINGSGNIYYDTYGDGYFLGYGTAAPSAKIHVYETNALPFMNIGDNTLSGSRAMAFGDEITNSGDYSLAFGALNTNDGSYCLVFGSSNNCESNSFNCIIGSSHGLTGLAGAYNFVFGDSHAIDASTGASNNFIFGGGSTIFTNGGYNFMFGQSMELTSADYCFGFGPSITFTTDHDNSAVFNLDGIASATSSKGASTFYIRAASGVYIKAGTLNIVDIPTSPVGLSTGDVYNDSGTLKIVT